MADGDAMQEGSPPIPHANVGGMHDTRRTALERRFELAEHIKVAGANLVNGLLHVDMVRELPEEKKPRKIAIETPGAKRIDNKAA